MEKELSRHCALSQHKPAAPPFLRIFYDYFNDYDAHDDDYKNHEDGDYDKIASCLSTTQIGLPNISEEIRFGNHDGDVHDDYFRG